MKLRLQKLITFLLIFVLSFSMSSNLKVHAEDELNEGEQRIRLLIDNVPQVDIKLAVGDTDINIDAFKEDLIAELESRGIDTSNFHVITTEQTTVSTEMADAGEIFSSWGRIGWTGQWSYDSSTKTITNAENTDNFTGFYYPHSFKYRDIDFSYWNCTTDLDDDYMGAMVRFNVNPDGTVTTYVFSLGRSDNGDGWQNLYHGYGLYKIVQKPFEYPNVELLQSTDAVWTRNQWTKYRILADGNNIQVYQDGVKLIDYTDNIDPIEEGSYGFFSFSQAYSMYKDITVVTENTLTFTELLRKTQWDEDSLHFLINLNESEEDFFSDEELKEEVTSTLQANEIHYIGWGSDILQEITEEYVGENANRGTFINSSNYTESILEIADYIIWRTAFPEGSGLESDPYIIRNSGQIRSVNYDLSAYYRLEESIDFNGSIFEGIGTYGTPFTGHFDGNGCSIRNCIIRGGVGSEDFTDYTGFFRVINDAQIRNVNLTDIEVYGKSYTGGLIGYGTGSETVIEKCSVGEVSIYGEDYVGGIAGWMESGTMLDCESYANIFGARYIGGVAGSTQNVLLKNILSLANVTGKECVGGIVGLSTSTRIEQCQTLANVNGNKYIGGVTGYHNGNQLEGMILVPDICSCDSLANIKGDSYVGGIAGYAECTGLEDCYCQGTIEGNVYLGGIIGAEETCNVTECQDFAQIMNS